MKSLRICALLSFALSATSLCVAEESSTISNAAEMTARIDVQLRQRWELDGIKPAAGASDSEFLRRVSLDLTGRIPEVSRVRAFLDDPSSEKRAQLVDQLLISPAHATHFSNLWSAFLLPEQPGLRRFNATPFRSWLRGQFADNQSYDDVVRELLLATGQVNQGPAYYYTSQLLKPETLAANTSRALLGVQIQCAQCHDHPFDDWTQENFWEYAAFFAQLQRPANRQAFVGSVQDADTGEVKLPDTETIILPRLLNGVASPDAPEEDKPSDTVVDSETGEVSKTGIAPKLTRRQRLTNWLVAADNPYFAKAAVNRVWAIMFGRGLVDPVDNFSASNLASHPKLLNELAEFFINSGYDVRHLVRTIANSEAYQLSSSTATGDPADDSLFARMAAKTLTAEQLYDCLAQATARRQGVAGTANQFAGRLNQARFAFINQFRSSGEATDYLRGIPQALTLMNGQLVSGATGLQSSDILAAMQAPFFTDEQRVETLFLATLARRPNEIEHKQFVEHVAAKSTAEEKHQALSDILWALLNSAEFTLNH
jgi:hypothetical protein